MRNTCYLTRLLAMLALFLPGVAAIAQDRGAAPVKHVADKDVADKDAAEKDVASKARKLPRVLLIGDTSFSNHFDHTQKALKNRAVIVRSPLGYLPTGAALARIDELLTKQKWDIVCCNFGLGDLMCKDPRSKQIRAMSPLAGGVPVTVPKMYAENLGRLVTHFKKASSKVVWITTLPLHPRQRSGALDATAIAKYNAIALATMRDCSVPVLDLHAQIESLLAKANNHRAKERLHHQLFKGDLSAPLVACISEPAKR